MSTDRRLWSPEEDQQIVRLVSKFGTKKWPLISEKLCAETEFERTGKQCRERWYNHLNPEINNSFWSPQDERRLFEAHKQHGNKWKAISKEFVGRTDNSIKNHFYSTIRRCLRRINKFQGEKNSTLKMRNIKPYVLSKILADRNLTETILEMGKIKPNKSRREYNPEYFLEFNQMIEKLYEINKEYEIVKALKRSSGSLPKDGQPSDEDDDEIREMEAELSEKSESPKSEKLKASLEKIEAESNGKADNGGEELSPKKKNKRPKKRVIIHPPSLPKEILFKEPPLSRAIEATSTRRYRRPINYMKLNQGILCESQRPQVDDTNYESDPSKKKIEHPTYDPFSFEEKQEGANLEEIEEEDQKSNEKDNFKHLFSHDFLELKPLGSFHISNPSPSYKHHSHFDELVIIGTHLRLHASQNYLAEPNEVCQNERKKSEEEFLQQILEINFDPNQAFASKEDEGEDGEEEN